MASAMLYPLAGIVPPEVRRELASRTEKAKREQDSRHSLYGNQLPRARLNSRNFFLRFTRSSESSGSDQRRELWKERYLAPPNFISPADHLPPGHELQWPIWKSLNRLRVQVGRCRDNLARWGFFDPSQVQCQCGVPSQDMRHLLSCLACTTTCTFNDLYEANERAVQVAKYWSDKI
ncbi:hypothetical protein PYW08_000669 [Mythimna loreyi]|uniref:Uncharacterized protein n=1 Tax=Mythimna loreyi TaxID=667449 RepID=A0ACC2RD34_9NEOP|nr:hypothetical protein PYW08_000669 [Mythimna loreyi]